MSPRREAYPVKQGDILDAAWELFATQGYERTGVQAIIDKLGISKGTFYHYFPSKEAVFDGVLERMCAAIVEAVTEAVSAPGLGAADRLRLFITASQGWKMGHLGATMAVGKVAYREELAAIVSRATLRANASLAPHLADVVRQGVAEGTFLPRDPETAADLFLAFLKALGDTLGPALVTGAGEAAMVERLLTQTTAAARALEFIVGAPPGTLTLADRAMLERAVQGLQGGA